MGKGKGPGGMSAKEALLEVIQKQRRISASELFEEVKYLGEGMWTDDHISQRMMWHTVNLWPAYIHWPSGERFLFQKEDGFYELYDPGRHGSCHNMPS